MATTNGTRARRTSSKLSLTSNSTDSRSTYTPSTQPTSGFREPSPAGHLQQLSPDVRSASASTHSTYISPSGRYSPVVNPAFTSWSPPPASDDVLLPPPRLGEAMSQSSSPTHSRPGSRAASPARPDNLLGPGTSSSGRLGKRKSWLPGVFSSKPSGKTDDPSSMQAWIIGEREGTPYDISTLLNAQKVPELWDENGNLFLYLCPRKSGQGPSFRFDSSIIASSRTLTLLADQGPSVSHSNSSSSDRGVTAHMRQMSLSVPGSEQPTSSRRGSGGSRTLHSPPSFDNGLYFDEPLSEIHIHLPLGLSSNAQSTLNVEEIDIVVAVRNMFAFLEGEPLVATPRVKSVFSVLMHLADALRHYEFSNMDGSTFGEVAASSCTRYIDEFRLADVKGSREKTIEAIVLGERMRSWELYNEGFVHGCGKWDELVRLKSPKFALIGDVTRSRMERASLDLSIRLNTVQTRLTDFFFPSLFAGTANSTTSDESKTVRFKAWRNSFMSTRKYIMSLYKKRYGAWPPKARSKKNDFEESGLNRLLLQEVYQDFSDLYDMLVDRTALTTRSTDQDFEDPSAAFGDPGMPMPRALRKVLGEFDRSTPPVQPPIPFDVPSFPSLSSTRKGFDDLDMKRQIKEQKKRIKDNEIHQAFMQGYNKDAVKLTPFLEAWLKYERKSAHGKSIDDIQDLRAGQWIFIYAVLQSLPLVVVDAPHIKCTHGVEYFLCEVPRGAVPWAREDTSRKQGWYGVAGGSGVVNLPQDVVEHGVEGIYHRSHCWRVAEKWTGQNGFDIPNAYSYGDPHFDEDGGLIDDEPLPLPPGLHLDSRPGSRGSSVSSAVDGRSGRNSVQLGLEALPLPRGVSPSGSRRVSTYDPTKNFENILAQVETPQMKKK